LFFILIVIGLVWLFPKLGSYLGERLNRFGLYSQAIGLVSLLPDYFKLKLEKWNPKFQNWAIWLYKRRTEIYYFRTTWDDSIFDEQRKGYYRLVHTLVKILLGGLSFTLWQLSTNNKIHIHPVMLWLDQVVIFIFMIWVFLGLSRMTVKYFYATFLFGKLFTKLYLPLRGIVNLINRTFSANYDTSPKGIEDFTIKVSTKLARILRAFYFSLDGILFLIVYSPLWIIVSLLSYIFATGHNATEKGIEDLAKQIAAPFVFVGTVAELVATYFPVPNV